MQEQYLDLPILAGTDKDNTSLRTKHYSSASRIRFYDGLPQKLGGWTQDVFDNGNTIDGYPRNIYSQVINDTVYRLVGTNTRLYSYVGTNLVNITPISTTTNAIANSLDSYYKTLAANPFTMVNGSTTVTVADASTKVRVGDTVTISGVGAAVRGVPAVELNTTHYVRTQSTNSFTFDVTTAATSSGTGGGGAVVLATPIITVNAAANGLPDGDRVKITLAVGFAGIPAGEINAEHIIRNAQTNAFDIVVSTAATSSVTGGGGAATLYQKPIATGSADASAGIGYGMGRYGVGLYGVSKTSASGTLIQPRIWSFDAFGDYVVLTAGGQTGLYYWDGDTSEAPIAVPNAPTAIDYVFVSNQIVVTLGASGKSNRIKWCDQGDFTTWASSAQNQAGEDDIEGAAGFISAVTFNGMALLFTSKQTYSFRYIGAPIVWDTQKISSAIGIIGRNARIEVNGTVFWISQNDFNMYSGSVIKSIPSNSETGVNYVRRYIFDNMSQTQYSKCFAWYNFNFNEIWFHAPFNESLECNYIARFNMDEGHWTFDDASLDRSAAEYPVALSITPYLASSTGYLYKHENGVNDNDSAMAWSLTTRTFGDTKQTYLIDGIIPDSYSQIGDITLTSYVLDFPQGTPRTVIAAAFDDTTQHVDFRNNGKYFYFTLEQDAIDTYWRSGQFRMSLVVSTPK